MRILIVEDEQKLAEVIKARLEKEKYIVDTAFEGDTGLYMALSQIYDLIILDVMLPLKNGFEILTEIRSNNLECKIIMLTAKSQIDDKLKGFNLGANDYLTKPFHMDELVARVNAQLRIYANYLTNDLLEVGDISLNIKSLTLKCLTNNEEVQIVGKEFLLLEYLMRNPNQIVSKIQIYDKIWGIDNESESNNLEAYLSFIRKKLRLINSNVNIKAIRGLGYKLEVTNDKVK